MRSGARLPFVEAARRDQRAAAAVRAGKLLRQRFGAQVGEFPPQPPLRERRLAVSDDEHLGRGRDVVARREVRDGIEPELKGDHLGICVERIAAAHALGGYNARGMIIQSLLDTDLYKFTMMQVVLHHFPGRAGRVSLQVPHRGRRPAA